MPRLGRPSLTPRTRSAIFTMPLRNSLRLKARSDSPRKTASRKSRICSEVREVHPKHGISLSIPRFARAGIGFSCSTFQEDIR